MRHTTKMVASNVKLVQEFLKVGAVILGVDSQSRIGTAALVEKFRSNFKYSPSRCAYIYSRIVEKSEIPMGYEPKHLLWTLYFLLTYATERRMCCFFKADRKTIRKFTWPTISAIASLHRQYVSSEYNYLMKRNWNSHIDRVQRFVGRTDS